MKLTIYFKDNSEQTIYDVVTITSSGSYLSVDCNNPSDAMFHHFLLADVEQYILNAKES